MIESQTATLQPTHTPTNTPIPTLTPLPSPTPDSRPGLLFADYFSNPDSGWDRITEDKGSTDYANGGYLIVVDDEYTDYWANPGQHFFDVRIEVEVEKIGGDDDNDFGVICRYQDVDNFYAFKISSDGYFGIFKRINGGPIELIFAEFMQFSEVINQGNERNHLTVECVGNRLSLFINGWLLQDVYDGDLQSGDVGLMAGSYGDPGTRIQFDDFEVFDPR
ncbi:MAG: hypothetical protein FVQ83_16450 [Chloroflexi bacterium]|nr:hypothetical protein [Chloroflexota bacterium]